GPATLRAARLSLSPGRAVACRPAPHVQGTRQDACGNARLRPALATDTILLSRTRPAHTELDGPMTRGIPVCLAALFALAAPAAAADGSWAFTPPRRPTPPTVRDHPRVANPIDAFVFAKLEAHKLSLGAPADRAT